VLRISDRRRVRRNTRRNSDVFELGPQSRPLSRIFPPGDRLADWWRNESSSKIGGERLQPDEEEIGNPLTQVLPSCKRLQSESNGPGRPYVILDQGVGTRLSHRSGERVFSNCPFHLFTCWVPACLEARVLLTRTFLNAFLRPNLSRKNSHWTILDKRGVFQNLCGPHYAEQLSYDRNSASLRPLQPALSSHAVRIG